MKPVLALILALAASTACAQSYTVTSIPNDFAAKDLGVFGTTLNNAFIDPATQASNTDDGVAGPVPLLFDFDFFGSTYDECYVSTNGFISFSALTDSYPSHQASVPQTGGADNFIAALWKNLGINPIQSNAPNIRYETFIGSGLGQWEFRLQIQTWPDQGQTSTSASNDVIICLYQATGVIEIHFGHAGAASHVSSTYGFACGIENASGTEGYACTAGWTGIASDGMAYRFEPVATQPGQLQIDTADPLPDGTEGTAYSLQFQASGGVPGYSWFDASTTTTGQPLPTGWTLDVNGVLSAAAQDVVAGTYTFDITVSDTSAAGLVTQAFTVTILNITVPPPPLQITTADPLPDGTEGVAYSVQFQATGGPAGYTMSWSYPVTAPIPAGWSLDADGLLTAAAQDVVAGTYTFDISVTTATTVTKSFSVTIDPATGGGGGTPPTAGSGGGASGCSSSGLSLTPWIFALLGAALIHRRKRRA